MIKLYVQRLARKFGYEIRRVVKTEASNVAKLGIGEMEPFLRSVKERGFIPRGVIDVGANRGEWTRMALGIFPDTRVLMLEPQPELRPYLQAIRQDHPKAEYVLAGAGASQGELVQTIWDDLAGSSFLPKVDESLMGKGQQRRVPIVTIDDLLNARPQFDADLVKLDVQGFELEVLKGGTGLFGRTELFVLEASLFAFMEGMPLVEDCVAFMRERGYALYDVPGFLRRPRDGALGQIDLAFAKREGRLRNSNQWDAST